MTRGEEREVTVTEDNRRYVVTGCEGEMCLGYSFIIVIIIIVFVFVLVSG